MAYNDPNYPNLNIPETPNLTDEERKRAIAASANQMGLGYGMSGDKTMIMGQGGTATNFPTARDVGQQPNMGLQNALGQQAAQRQGQPPPAMPELWQRQQYFQQQSAQHAMFGKDPTKFRAKVSPTGHVSVHRLTPQEQHQQWRDVNVMAMADTGNVSKDGKRQSNLPLADIFSEQGHGAIDDPFRLFPVLPGDTEGFVAKKAYDRATIGTPDMSPTERANTVTSKIQNAIIRLGHRIESIDEARDLIKNLNI